MGRRCAAARKGALLARGVLILAAWLSYYSAAKWLPLAELVTLYFAAPIFVMVLSIVILKEKVTLARWITAGVGFAGVALASDPSGAVNLLPAAMVLASAFLWAWTNVLVRIISRTEATATQMIASNFIFAVGCATVLPFLWVTPTLTQLLLLLGLGVAGGAGQYFVFEGFRHAPASAVNALRIFGAGVGLHLRLRDLGRRASRGRVHGGRAHHRQRRGIADRRAARRLNGRPADPTILGWMHAKRANLAIR